MSSFTPRWMMDPDFEIKGYMYKQKFIYTGDDHDINNNDEDDNKYFNDLICKYKKIHIYTVNDNEEDNDDNNLINSYNTIDEEDDDIDDDDNTE